MKAADTTQIPSLKGNSCLVTGANSGIGLETCRELARRGARVIMVCRDRERGERAREDIAQSSENAALELMICDLSTQAQVRGLAAEYKARYDRLHVLVNNAGILPGSRVTTAEGIELQWAVNHLAPFLLTNLLLDVLKSSAPSRVVTVSSGLHRNASLDDRDLQGTKKYRAMSYYGKTKLANVYFTYELSRRLEGTGVTANCLGPGFTATRLGRDFSPFSRWFMKVIGKSPEKGAETVVHLASSPEVVAVTGKYFEKCREKRSGARTYDQDMARRLWVLSERLTQLG